jgi:PAS domain S-box-containing protein
MQSSQSQFPWLAPFDDSTAVTMLIDRDGAFLWVNRRAATTLGRPSRELIGNKLADMLLAEDLLVGPQPIFTAIDERRVVEGFRGFTLNNVTHWFELRYVPVAPERTAGHGWCVLVHAADVTAQVQLAALNALLGFRHRDTRKLDNDERFVRLLLHGTTIRGLCTTLRLSVDQVTGRLTALAGTPLG